jgi:Mechanosensitive ion channel, beta-domain
MYYTRRQFEMIFQESGSLVPLDNWGHFSIGGWIVPYLGLLIYFIVIGVFLLLYWYLSNLLMKKSQNSSRSEDFLHNVKFFQRILWVIILLILGTNLLNIDTQHLNVVLGILFTAITFASVKSLTNFIVGIYISITRPFVVGDFVDIGGVTGLIIEINLNYIRIKHTDASVTSMPNINCLKSQIINYSISVDYLKQQIEKLKKNVFQKTTKLIKHEDPDLRMTVERLEDHLDDLKTTLLEILGIQNKYLLRKEKEEEIQEKRKEQLKKDKKKWNRIEEEEQKRREVLWEEWKTIERQEKEHQEEERKKWKEMVNNRKEKGKISPEMAEKKRIEWETVENELRNERIKKKKEIKVLKQKFRESQIKDREENRKKFDIKEKFHQYSRYVDEDKIVMYNFSLQLSRTPAKNKVLLNQVCTRWADEFETTPNWEIAGIGAKITYLFTIITPDPYDIIHHVDEFIQDVYLTFFSKPTQST